MNWIDLLAGTFASVLKASGHASVLIAFVLFIQFACRTRLSASWRYGLWTLVLLRLIFPVFPQSEISLFNYARVEPIVNISIPYPSPVEGSDVPIPGPRRLNRPDSTPFSIDSAAPSLEAKQTQPMWSMRRVLGVVWAVGVFTLGLRLFLTNLMFARRLKYGVEIQDASVVALFKECSASLGVSKSVRLLQTSAVETPALWGLFRTSLLLPPGLVESYSRDELRYIFLHESAHLKRLDMPVNWLVLIANVVHWFNPFVWFANTRLRADREMACDCLVLSRFEENRNEPYGKTIVGLMQGISRPAAVPSLVGIIEDNHEMKRRISMIACYKHRPQRTILMMTLLLVLGAIALTDAQTKKAVLNEGLAAESTESQESIVAEIEKFGGRVTFDESNPDRPIVSVRLMPGFGFFGGALSSPQLTEDLFMKIGSLKNLKTLRLGGTRIPENGLKHLSSLMELQFLDLFNTEITDRDISHLKGLTSLQNLRLMNNNKITDTSLAYLAGLQKLTNLNVANTAVTGLGFAQLSMPKLTHLEFRAPFGDKGLAALKNVPNLRLLNLIGTEITDAGLEHIKNFPKLEALHMHSTMISDAGVAHLKNLPNLLRLTLTWCPNITDGAMEHLKGMTNLQWLRIVDTKVGDDGLLALKNLTKLNRMDLNGTQVTDRGLAVFEHMPDMRNLTAGNTKITDAGMDYIAKLSKLRLLWLGGTAVADAGLEKLSGLTNLQTLKLEGTQLTEASVPHLKKLAHVRSINLTLNGTGVTDETLSELAELSNIRGLSLKQTSVSDSGLAFLDRMSNLQELGLHSIGISDQGLAGLSSLSQLGSLVVEGNQFTDAGVAHLKNVKNLYELTLHSSRISDESLDSLQELQQLNSLDLSGTDVSDDGIAKLKELNILSFLTLDDTRVSANNFPDIPNMSSLSLAGSLVTDNALLALNNRKEPLWKLDVARTQITDDGLIQLKGVAERLNVSNTKISDAGLLSLNRHTQLKILTVHAGQMSDHVRSELLKSHPRLTITTVDRVSSN